MGGSKGCRECLKSFEIWCWRRREKIQWANNVKNEDIVEMRGVEDERKILNGIRRRKIIWIGDILRRICLLRDVIKGKKEQGIRKKRMQLLDDPKGNKTINS